MTNAESICAGVEYEEYRGLLTKIVARFCRVYCFHKFNHFADMMGEASLAFCHAYEKYDPEIGEFVPYLWKSVNSALFRYRKNNGRNVFPSLQKGEDDASRDGYWIEDKHGKHVQYEELSENGNKLINLVVNPPIFIRKRVEGKNTVPNWRKAIKDYLLEMEWTIEEITAAYLEVRQILK